MLKRGSGWRSCGGNANRSPTASSASSSSLSTGAACDSRTFGLWPLTAIQDGIFPRRPVALISPDPCGCCQREWTTAKKRRTLRSFPNGRDHLLKRWPFIFSNDGHFSLFQSRAEIPKIAANDRAKATPEEAQSIVASSITAHTRLTKIQR
jgi:hypothetical protein